MPSEIFVVGLSWRSAPVSVREKVAFADAELPGSLSELTSSRYIAEAVLLSTCNRVEIYGCTPRSSPTSAVELATAHVRSFLPASRGLSAEALSEVLYERIEGNAIRHIFQVASAVDSLVLGETQILGQLKAAYGEAVRCGALGTVLGRCMESAFRVAKRVRNETGLSRGAANVSSVAVDLARRVFGSLAGKHILVVGAGKMSVLAARHLRAGGASSVTVTNRSPARAEALADEIDGVARPWEELVDLVGAADVIIASTGSKEPVLTKKLVKEATRRRRHQSLVIVDIAVPRDVEASVGKLSDVYLFDIDDLEKIVAENLKERSREAEKALKIIETEVGQFEAWVSGQQVVPTIRALRERFHRIAAEEADRAVHALENAQTAEEREHAVRRFGELVVNKLLHTPSTALKHSDEDRVIALVDAANRLFDLPSEEDHQDGESKATLAPGAELDQKEGAQ